MDAIPLIRIDGGIKRYYNEFFSVAVLFVIFMKKTHYSSKGTIKYIHTCMFTYM